MRYIISIIILLSLTALADGAKIYKKTIDSVVLILTEEALGSGAIISESGYVISNYHVVENASEVEILLNNAESAETAFHKAMVVHVNPKKDLALLKILNPKVPLKKIGISIVVPEVGAEAHAIGHPDGEIWSYTMGYVSQIRKDYDWDYENGTSMTANVYQIQTPITGGNSGGPLINSKGNLIGINTFGSTEHGFINYAITVDEIIRFLGSK